jgi:addiction module HigA family antidote
MTLVKDLLPLSLGEGIWSALLVSAFESGDDVHVHFGLRDLSLMPMHNPPHPGEFITEVYLKPNNLSARELAAKLGVAASTLHRVLIGSSSVSPEMALRLSKALGTDT